MRRSRDLTFRKSQKIMNKNIEKACLAVLFVVVTAVGFGVRGQSALSADTVTSIDKIAADAFGEYRRA